MLKYGETHTKAAPSVGPIFILQKKIVRIVYGANFSDHTDVIFQDLKILTFYDLVKLKICEVMLNNIFTVCEPNCLFNMRKKKILYINILGLTLQQCLSLWLVQSCGMRLILIYETQKLFCYLKKNQMGCTTHVCITCLSIFVLKNVVRR